MRVTARRLAPLLALSLLVAGCAAQDGPAATPEPPTEAPTEAPADDAGSPPDDEPAADREMADDPPGEDVAREDDPPVAPPADAAVEALDVQGRTLAGDRFDGREFAGQPVVLWMWAPW